MTENSNKTLFIVDDYGVVIGYLTQNALGIPYYLKIHEIVLWDERKCEIVREFLKNVFKLYVEIDDLVNCQKTGHFSAWLFENPNEYQELTVDFVKNV